MPDPILYHIDDLTLTDTCLIHRDTSMPYASIASTSICHRRPLLWVGAVGTLGFAASCTARFWGAGLLGSRMSFKLGLLMAIPAAIATVYGFAHKVSCLQLWLDDRPVTVLQRKDPYPIEVAQRVIETAKRAYGVAGDAAARRGAGDLRSDLNPL